jgi:signal transduction histidine kinase
MLNNNVSSLHSLLEDVTDLARLQAGHERRQLKPFDAAVALGELCERMQPLVEERALYLTTEGPAKLAVEGDAVKVQRIAQNLLLNAIKYTTSGGVAVSWGDSRENDSKPLDAECAGHRTRLSCRPWRSYGCGIGRSYDGDASR